MIERDMGETMIFTGGSELDSPRAEVVEYLGGGRHTPYILALSNGAMQSDSPLLISLESLKEIVKWAEGESH